MSESRKAYIPIAPPREPLPLFQLILVGLQHVLLMYGGAIAVPLIIGQAAGFHAVAMEEKENGLTGCDLWARKVADATVHLLRGLAGPVHGQRHPDRMPLGLALSPGQPKRSPHNVPVGRVVPFIEPIRRVAACVSRHRQQGRAHRHPPLQEAGPKGQKYRTGHARSARFACAGSMTQHAGRVHVSLQIGQTFHQDRRSPSDAARGILSLA